MWYLTKMIFTIFKYVVVCASNKAAVISYSSNWSCRRKRQSYKSSVTLFFIPLVELGVTVPLLLCTPFFQLCLFHIYSVVSARTYTQSWLFPSISHLILSLTHLLPTRPFLYSFLHRPILSLYEQAMHEHWKKRKQQDEILPPSRLVSLHFDNWETFGSMAWFLRSLEIWW